MKDSYGRKIEYVRISVTDRCNLRCIYCMPEHGVTWRPREEMLTYEEIVHLTGILAAMGVKKVRLTGGEPLVRPKLHRLVGALKAVPGIDQVMLTTNGLLLKEMLPKLMEAGLDGVNISLDTTDADQYAFLTRSSPKTLQTVLEAVDAALSYPQLTVKINCVPMRGINEENLRDLADKAKDRPLAVRFIEMMPLGQGCGFEPVPEDEVKQRLGISGTMSEKTGESAGGPCVYYRPEGFCGKIGFISAVSHKFCSGCNRVRLTGEGFLKTCIQSSAGVDLKAILRGGQSPEEVDIKLKSAIEAAIAKKPKEHHFGAKETEETAETRKMFQIGG